MNKIISPIETELSAILADKDITTDSFNLIIADLLDVLCYENKSGGYRVVLFPIAMQDIVIKIEYTQYGKQNVMENEVWNYLSKHEPEKAKFYAPVKHISKNGKVLIQQRVHRIAQPKDFFREDLQGIEIPAAFLVDDPHVSNFGWIENQFVCIDYGFPEALTFARDKMIPFEKFKNLVMSDDSYWTGSTDKKIEADKDISACKTWNDCIAWLNNRK